MSLGYVKHLPWEVQFHLKQNNHTRMQQVVMNLCLNARDAIEKQGKIKVITRRLEIEKPIKGMDENLRPGIYALIEVQDNGKGMDEKTKQRIFEPFFTTKQATKGTGLGLSMTYGFIKSHHGFIDVDTKVGKGTSFRIFLPASEKEAVKRTEKGKTKLDGKNKGILIVDDEQDMRNFLKKALSQNDYTIYEACDGKEALEQYQKYQKNIALVIMDMIMPRMDGQELLKRLRAIDCNLSILISTGFSERRQLETIESQIDGIIYKPYGMEDILHKVGDILG